MRNKQFLYFSAALLILLSSCGENKASTEKTEKTTSAQATPAEPATQSSSVLSNIKVTITGGNMAGSYEAVCKEGCCSWGIAGDNVFGNQYSESGKGPKELSSVQLMVNDVKGNKTTKEFTLTVSFGELFAPEGTNFNIDTRNGHHDGSGTLDLQYEGDKAMVAIKGVSKEGPAIDLKMECHKVMTMKNLGQ